MSAMSAHTRHVLSLPLDTNVRSKLISCGFSYVENFKDFLNPEDLKAAVNISTKEAEDVIEIVARYVNYKPLTPVPNLCGVSEGLMSSNIRMESVAYLLRKSLKSRHLARHIVSFSSEVDKLLGGGFPMGRITEIAGEAGTGKSQFCFQLCVDVQIPRCLGGIEGNAVFLDVEGTFYPQRVAQIARAAVDHCGHIAELSENEECIERTKTFTVDSIMSGIFLFRCHNSVQLLAAVHRMREFLRDHPKVKLLIVDSIAQSVRGDEDINTRTKVLVTLGRMFRDLAIEFEIAVVLTNQVSTHIDGDGDSYNIPALGATWSHIPSVKTMLCKQDDKRYLYQYKSPCHQNGSALYRVTSEGIRDESIPHDEAEESSSGLLKSQADTSSQETAIPFYPITQGLATELLEDWNTQALTPPPEGKSLNKNHSQDDVVKIREETIPDKWLLLSQRQLKTYQDSENEEEIACENPGDSDAQEARPISQERRILKPEIQQLSESENSMVKGKESGTTGTLQKVKNICNNQSQKLKTRSAVQATVAAMLFSDEPVKPPPKKRQKKEKIDEEEWLKDLSGGREVITKINHLEKQELTNLPDITEAVTLQDDSYKEQSPPSPVLKTNRRKSRRKIT